MAKRLLVLGIGPSQVDLIEMARDMGMRVYGCARDGSGPGRALVDEFRPIDIADVEAVRRYAEAKQVDFIYSMGLERAVPTIALVSGQLGLPSFCSVASLSKFETKARWREVLGNMEGNVRFKKGSSVEDFADWDIYPAVLKPVDSSGQRGVHRVTCFGDVERYFSAAIGFSRKKELIIEEFIDGPEVSVNTFMYNGCLAFSVVTDRISYSEYPGGIIKEHRLPSLYTSISTEEKIRALVTRVNELMGFGCGHVYFQLKISNDTPKVVEFTPRFDACHMWRLIYESTGLDLRRVALEVLSTGKSEALERRDFGLKEGHYTLRFISDKPGVVFDERNYDLPKDPLYVEWYYHGGDTVKSVTGYVEKVGYVLFRE